MNLKHYSAMLAAAAMLAACSSDEPMADNGAQGQPVGEGYLAVDIKLPSRSGSRASTLEDGLASEYAVSRAQLIVFQKPAGAANEFEYTYVETAELKGFGAWNTSSNTDITVSATCVAKLASVSVTDDTEYFGYVLLNNPASNGVTLPATNQTFGQWLNTVQKPTISSSSLLMASAPQWSKAGAVPASLVKIDKTKIAASEANASVAGSAATFNVERSVAKVSVTTASFEEKNVSGSVYAGDKVTINKWALDVVNKSMYGGRNLQGLSGSYADIWKNEGATTRFIAGNAFKRVEFSNDPNFNKDITTAAQMAENFTLLTDAQLDASTNAVRYIMENTFDVNHQMQGQTTRVVFKATYVPNGITAGENFYQIGSASTIWSEANLKTNIENVAKTALGKTNVVFTLPTSMKTQAGNHALTTADIKVDGAAISDANLATVVAALGLSSGEGIQTFLEGKCFYVARIKHFGDDETPWHIGESTYGGDNAKYLGRYGVTRNTWYEVAVSSISSPGSPVLPTIDPTDPDDVADLYLSVSIQIIPWSKRVNNVDL